MTNQSRTAIVGLARFVLFVALFIFVPAWSLDYWEAWLYLALLSISITLLTWYFLKQNPALVDRRMHCGPRAETEKSQQIIQSIGGVFLGAIFIVSGFEHRMHGSIVSPPTVLAATGLLMVSTYIVFRTFQENTFAGSTVRVEANQHVISSGPYGWIRHPMYSGCFVGFLATPLAHWFVVGDDSRNVEVWHARGSPIVRRVVPFPEAAGLPSLLPTSAVSVDSIRMVKTVHLLCEDARAPTNHHFRNAAGISQNWLLTEGVAAV